ncbi:hypothetical protein HE1_01128 [Holospora elegans E1]|uniref:Uncharacterized protein n=1 Tax=Holospora elegans E1 TaxID=1427503 RepID=A0A023E124_9PROT|nr:hypothetical protein [Holospora elegans]GAJ46787.1 hypothetical protein HE1_01128 [Holospora elegans E1]
MIINNEKNIFLYISLLSACVYAKDSISYQRIEESLKKALADIVDSPFDKLTVSDSFLDESLDKNEAEKFKKKYIK